MWLQRSLFCTFLALNLALTLAEKPVKSTRIKEIAPVFRRNPYRSSTTSKPSTTAENTTSEDVISSSEEAETKSSDIDNEFYVGQEHYYDNRIDIQKENDDTDIEESEVTETKTDLKEAETSSDELVYDNDEYYYDDYEEPEEEYYLRKQRQERLKRLQERRRAWLRNQREKYFKSLTRWRQQHRPIDSYRTKPSRPRKHHKRPPRPRRPPKQPTEQDNRRHYESQHSRNTQSNGESTSLMRSLLGVSPFCVHDDAQFSCTFTPYCWMKGGVAMSGCDSMLYSCCVSHTIARRQVRRHFLFF